MRNSYERLKSIQTSLIELSNSLDEQYCKMYQECRDEIINDRREYETKKNEMYSLYEKISDSDSMRMTWIKNKLPWYIIKFCKKAKLSSLFKCFPPILSVSLLFPPNIFRCNFNITMWYARFTEVYTNKNTCVS